MGQGCTFGRNIFIPEALLAISWTCFFMSLKEEWGKSIPLSLYLSLFLTLSRSLSVFAGWRVEVGIIFTERIRDKIIVKSSAESLYNGWESSQELNATSELNMGLARKTSLPTQHKEELHFIMRQNKNTVVFFLKSQLSAFYKRTQSAQSAE